MASMHWTVIHTCKIIFWLLYFKYVKPICRAMEMVGGAGKGGQGCNRAIFDWGRRYICNRKDEIIHGPSPSVKCVLPLLDTGP